jgi:hypothetical protein
MILATTFGFISGIALASFVHITTVYFYVLSFVALLCFIYRYFVEGEDRKRLTLFSVFFLFVLVGVLRVNISNLYSQSKLSEFENKKVQIVGVVVSEPDVREKNTKLTIETEKVFTTVGEREVSEKVLVSVPLYPEWNYGDRVRGNVILTKPKNIESEDGRVFDYEGYLKVRGIWYTSSYTSLEFLSSGNGNAIKTLLFKTKHVFTDSISYVLPEPESSLLAGLLLGTKQSLGKEILGEFQRTGTSHIVVLSGYNIAIVAESIMNALKFLPKNQQRQMEWESPWGKGFPGWHIECSAMAKKFLGKTFDIHCGGIDHIPIHHTNEIAQSESCNETPLANYWMHSAFLEDKGKMSKSNGNFITVKNLIEKGFSPLDFRYLCLGTHYRKRLLFKYEILQDAKNSLQNLKNKIFDLKYQNEIIKFSNQNSINSYNLNFNLAVNDDLNLSESLAIIWSLFEDKTITNEDKLRLIYSFDLVLGLNLKNQESVSQEILNLIEERKKEKNKKNFATADEIREKIKKLGYDLIDTKNDFILRKITV